MNLRFEVLFQDELIAKISIKDDKLEYVKTYTDDMIKQPFIKKPVTLSYVLSFLEKRSIPRNRYDIQGILQRMGLDHYDTLAILRITHGVDYDDFFWIKFEGENISWNDVRVR
jgi:hypothetical protein